MSVDETPVATCRSVSQGQSQEWLCCNALTRSAETVMDVDAIETPTEAEAFELAKEDEQNAQQEASLKEGGEQISAADYDPSKDRREDEHKRLLGENPHKHEVVVVEEELEGEEEEEVDDIFAVALGAPTKKLKKVKKTTLVSVLSLVFFFLLCGSSLANSFVEIGTGTYYYDGLARYCRRRRRLLLSYPR